MSTHTTLPQIPGYSVQGFIDDGATASVYKAEREGHLFAIKIFKTTAQLPEISQIQFRKEAASLARITHPGLVEVIEVGQTEGQNYFVMSFIEGKTLEQILTQGPLPPQKLLHLAQTLTETLCEIHRRGIVHRDLKPANILIDSQGQSKIIDFGLSIENTTTHQESIGGTFLYSAPEQIGLIQHLIDGRADLYSLGCVLFECATGHPPYAASHLSELLQILATQPPPSFLKLNPSLERQGLPQTFDTLIQKLLAKDPEDRFMNALQVLHALATPGHTHTVSHAPLEMPLIGRESELKTLTELWDLSTQGLPQTILIEAIAGAGKSRLVRELFKQTKNSVLFSSKCTMSARQPLGALRHALDEFLKQIKIHPHIQQEVLYTKIKHAVGSYGAILKNFSVELALLLTDIPDHVQAPSQDIYFETIATFFKALVQEFPALVLFMDDIQWLDDSSRIVLGKLNHLLKTQKSSPFLLIATCRAGAEYQKDLEQFQSELELNTSKKIDLGPLTEAAMQNIAKNYLGNREITSNDFMERIIRISQGSPLALVEYLRVMLDSGCLYPTWGTWTADLSAFDRLNLSTDVIQLIIQRISTLDPKTKSVLKVGAVLGSSFEKHILEKVLQKNTNFELMAAVQANLLDSESEDTYSFVHDRIQEALLTELTTDELKSLHTQTALVLDALLTENSDRNRVFAIADHYYQGDLNSHAMRCYTLTLNAANLAVESFSLQEAILLFDRCLEIQQKFNLSIDHLALLAAKADACLKSSQNREAMELLQQALSICTDPLQKGQLYAQLIDAHLGAASFQEATVIVEQALRSLGVPVPQSKIGFLFSIIRDLFTSLILHHTQYHFAKFKNAPLQKILCRIYFGATFRALTSGNTRMMLYLSFRQFMSAHLLGPSPELARAFSTLAILAAGIKSKKYRQRFCTKAESIAQTLLDPVIQAETLANQCLTLLILGRYQEAETESIQCMRLHHQWLNKASTLRIIGSLMVNQALRGKSKISLESLIPQIQPPHKLPPNSALTPQMAHMQIYACFGDFQTAQQDQQVLIDFKVAERVKNDPTINALFLATLGMLHYEMDSTCHNTDDLVRRYRAMHTPVKSLGITGLLYFAVQLHFQLKKCLIELESEQRIQKATFENFKIAYQELKKCRYPLTDQHAKIGKAALLWFQNQPQAALIILSQVEQEAKPQNNPWARFEALKLKALILGRIKHFEESVEEAKSALAIAIEMGWKIRAQRIMHSYQLKNIFEPSSGTLHSKLHSTMDVHQTVNSSKNMKYKRHLDALLELNRSAAHTGDFVQQARSALDEVIKILHAERGFLLLTSPNDQFQLQVQIARDSKKQDVTQLNSYSTSVVERVRKSMQPFIYLGEQTDLQAGRLEPTLSTSKSIVAHQLRSVIAVPLKKDNALRGVLYLDSTVTQGLFQEDDLAVLDAIAGYLTVNLEAAQARQLQIENSLLEKENELAAIRLTSAHAAGMAEIASGAIHNIGNSLTGVLSNFEQIKERIQHSKVNAFIDGSNLLKNHQENLFEFMTQNERGPLLLRLFIKLGDTLKKEVSDSLQQIETIEKGIEKVQQVVLMQQDYAKVGLHQEEVQISKIIEEILQLFLSRLSPNAIQIEKNLILLPPVSLQKNKFTHVLLNIFKNAMDAMQTLPLEQKILRIETSLDPQDPSMQIIRIVDRGCGIPTDKLKVIFNQGYTTKTNAQGFGLHLAANVMDEMGGSIEAQSPGPNLGATFTLRLKNASNTK